MFKDFFGKSKKISFDLPDKNFAYDSKTVSKLSSKDLILLCTDQDKYISTLLKKFDSIKEEYTKMTDKVEELTEKNQVINSETVRMSNQHEQLIVKFTNLENALEITLRQKEVTEKQFKGKYLKLKEVIESFNDGSKVHTGDIEVRLKQIISQYQTQSSVFKNIEVQNNKLKEKIDELEENKSEVEKSKQKIQQEVQSLRIKIAEYQSQIQKLKRENQMIKLYSVTIESNQNKKMEEDVSLFKATLSTLEDNSNNQNNQNTGSNQNAYQNTIITQIQQDPKQLNKQQQLQKLEQKQPEQQKQQKQNNNDLINRIKQLQQQLNKYSLLQQLLRDQELKAKSQSLIHRNQHLDLQRKQSTADNLQKRIITLINSLKEKRETIHYLEKLNEELKNTIYIELQTELKNKQKELERILAENKQKQQKYLAQKIEILKNHQQLDKALALKNQQLDELNKKLRKQETEINTNSIKADSLKKNIDKLNDQNKSYKQTIEKKYQQSVIYIEKATQLQDKVKEYKKEIQRLKMERVDVQQNHELKITELNVKISQFQNNIQSIKKESAIAQSAKEYQIIEKMKRLQEQVEDLTKETENQVRKIEEYEENEQRSKRVIQELSEKREHAIMQIQRLQKLNSQKGVRQNKAQTTNDIWAGSKSTEKQKQKVEEKGKQEKVDRTKKVAEKSFKAFGIILKLLQSLYKQFVNDYMSEIKEVRVQKLENAINQLITKTTDMKDIFKDYM